MSEPSFVVAYSESRSRLTVAFRYILAIPHIVIAAAWGYFAQLIGFVQWFIVLFTGRRNEGIWNLQHSWLGYSARVSGYQSLLFDEWPAIGPDPEAEPTVFRMQYQAEANRLTNALRFFWVIPAAIVLFFVGIGAFFVVMASWFTIVITGRHPRGMWDYLLRYLRFAVRVSAYGNLMTDEYPRWRGDEPTGLAGSGAPLAAPSTPPVG
ncbi:hypothetical protein BH24ACT5_BH24ACT5_30710 [soil metagenome]